jgi:CBS-domain-containing membrane protein
MRDRRSLLYRALGAALVMAAVAVAAWLLRAPMLVPPLGATTLLVMTRPDIRASSPRNVIVAHAFGMACGYLALRVTGMSTQACAVIDGFQPGHIASAMIALFLTILTTEGLGYSHPPAGATTLIVALGVLRAPWQLVAYEAGTTLLVVVAFVLHRFVGVDYPVWARNGAAKEPAEA